MQAHQLSIIDFAKSGQSIFFALQGVDGESNQPFAGEVKVLGNRVYGDIIHPDRSQLSESCQLYIKDTIQRKVQNQEI